MRKPVILAALALLAGCAETRIRARDGHTVMRMQADAGAAVLWYRDTRTGEQFVWYSQGIQHSTATLAGGAAFANGASGVGTLAAGIGSAFGNSGLGAAIAASFAHAVPATVAISKPPPPPPTPTTTTIH